MLSAGWAETHPHRDRGVGCLAVVHRDAWSCRPAASVLGQGLAWDSCSPGSCGLASRWAAAHPGVPLAPTAALSPPARDVAAIPMGRAAAPHG